MDSNSILIIIVVAILAFLVFYTIGVFNRLINSKNIVNDKWNEIDTQLKKKIEIVPKLIENVKDCAAQEENVFMAVLASRNKVANANSINDKIYANNKLNDNLKSLLELQNTYPKLAKNEKIVDLVNELKEIDSKIDYAKEFYNEAASKHNNKISKIPTSIIAKIFNFNKYELFKQ